MNRLPALLLFCSVFVFSTMCAQAQTGMSTGDYHPSPDRVNDLVHTRLQIRFDFSRAYAYGKAWITLRPHFYETDSLQLDAVGMTIHRVALSTPAGLRSLSYTYDSARLKIRLDKKYGRSTLYTIYVDYIARPDELKTSEGAPAVLKGMYFINPTGKDKDKPVQLWTQGEPRGTSIWCPTIDEPGQRSTQEFYITVPAKYISLSNGSLQSSTKNADGSRTDAWKMNVPHAPYLFLIAVGDFAVAKDHYRNTPVNYYVERKYLPQARAVFGHTPEMMAFFSRITGIDYPWPKYDQVVVRDYTSGAMENTTIAIHQEGAQQDQRELVDGNRWENIIAHELFHHWFGNYTTPESWSNLALSESFARYGESLWKEYKHGRDFGDEMNYNNIIGYLHSPGEGRALIRYRYKNTEEIFDDVTYNKGAQVLHMLRKYVGDSAFFQSLHVFLSQNKLRPVEASQLRLAFEEVTGLDLNWFFNQWFFAAGHPKLNISYSYNDTTKLATVTIKQEQGGDNLFRLPIDIDVYESGHRKRYRIETADRERHFTFACHRQPDLINVDADKVLLCERTDHKTLDNLRFQYEHAQGYAARREAIDLLAPLQDSAKAVAVLMQALNDRFEGIRLYTLYLLDLEKPAVRSSAEPLLATLATSERRPYIRSVALRLLARYDNPRYRSIFEKALTDSSYSVAGEALEMLSRWDAAAALREAKKNRDMGVKGRLEEVVMNILMEKGSGEDFDFVLDRWDRLPMTMNKFNLLIPFSNCLSKVDHTERFMRGVDAIVRFRDGVPAEYREQVVPMINNVLLKGIAEDKKKRSSGNANEQALHAQIRYVGQKIGDDNLQ